MNTKPTETARYHIHHFDEVDSTMNVAREMALAGCPDRTVVVADRQTEGRGRMDRRWHSAAGGLYFTVVLRPPVQPGEGFKYTFIAAFLLGDLLRSVCGIDALLKWPNDILAGGKKLSGMLSEMNASADRIHFLNIGIGLNVNNTPSAVEPNATSINALTGEQFHRQDLLVRFLDAMGGALYDTMPPAGVMNRWKHYATGLHSPVRVVTKQETIRGVAEDVDNGGKLVVRLEDGRRRRVAVGDCFF
ncbi:MAG: biotin--[acetyl-CoA-carboxylase] ligase [Thermodesulfobacteriota bacterium]|nr:biotin--[acetyl-CoA-carboxylase] ligase [Thermodesulfobacteriota bacterium]